MNTIRAIAAVLLLVLLAMPVGAVPPVGLVPGDLPSVAPLVERPDTALAPEPTLPAAQTLTVQSTMDIVDPSSAPTTQLEYIPADWWAAVQEDIRRSEYHVTWQGHTYLPGFAAAYQAPNRAQNLRTYFTSEGPRIIPRLWPESEAAPPWHLGLSLQGYGPAEELLPDANRVEYRWKGSAISEWYVNDESGLEQGWIVGIQNSNFEIQISLDTALSPVLVNDRTVEFHASAGTVVLRYGPFQALDAAGRQVPVHLSLVSSLLVSLSSDLPISYPLTIRARITSPAAAQDAPAGLFPIRDWIAESDQSNAYFGYAVGAAGDVNGDGYSDVIVGAPYYDNGQVDEGRAYVYPGSASGLGLAFLLTLEGDQDGAGFGHAVGTAGDVDGNGCSDIVVGAPYYDNGQVNEGRVIVFDLCQSPPLFWTVESDQDGAEFGCSVGTAGDVDGDGYDDIVVGAPYYSNGQDDEGCAYVYHGSAGGLLTAPAWTAEGDQAGALFGASVGAAGDVDGDGYGDVIVGAQFYENGQWDEGCAYVYQGSAAGLSPTPSWTDEGDQFFAGFGASVGTAGDVNGDGYDDVVVGIPYYDDDEEDEGRAYVYYGSVGGLSVAPSWVAGGDQIGAYFGYAVGTAGDVDGNGYSDLVVGAPYYDNDELSEGRTYVYHGSAGGLSSTPNWTAEGDQDIATFGYTVGAAGDVNRDGFADLVVGAPYYDNGQGDEGRTFVYHGSPSGLGHNWTAEGDQAGSRFGYAVGTAGDVNSDGYSDVVVGAPYYDNGQTEEGRAFVYLGSTSGLSTTAHWIQEINQGWAHFGRAVGTAGDVDGDGYADVIVGAEGYDHGSTWDVGAAFVYLGSATGLLTSTAWTAESDQGGAQFGRAVGSAGDVNGDGYSDVIVGAPYYDNSSTGGRAYVYLGSTSGLSTTAHWSQTSDQVYALFGWALGTAGDVDGDGYSDIIVGAEGHDSDGRIDNGRVYVYHGSADGVPAAPAWTADGDRTGAHLGRAVHTAGDVGGDGYSDVIVGAPYYSNGQNYEGCTYLYHGSAAGLLTSTAWMAEGDQTDAHFGWSVGAAGDVDGDGYSDVIVGTQWYSNGQIREGRAYVYRGSAGGLLSIPAWTTESDQSEARLGLSAGTAGDVNGDGYSDIIVGAPFDTGQAEEGRAYVYHGSAAGLARSGEWMAESDQASAQLGLSVGTAGDVNGDGHADMVVGVPYYDGGDTDEGRAYVFYGSLSGFPADPNWRAEGDQTQANLGFAVGTAGDVDGDGYADVIVGVPGLDNGQADEGALLVWHGSSTGLGSYGNPDNASWRAEGDQTNAYLGRAVGTAGDVNGDGYADVIAGAWGYDNGQTDEGRAYAYLGSAAGLMTDAVWSAEGDQASARFGWAVGTAGDVDGDGYSDIVVGAPRFDNGEDDEGRALVYRGSPAGLLAIPSWSAEGDQDDAQFGYAVGTAGDVNGDGYADMVVGIPYYDNGDTDEGRACVYYGSAAGTIPRAGSTVESGQEGAQFGRAVGTAGDVNGDGYADVIVGAPYYDNNQADQGAALVYYGAAGGLVVTAPWMTNSEQGGSLFGYAVGTVGDVNGDGCADVVVGMPLYSNGQGQASEGAAYLYYGNGGGGPKLTPRQMRSDGSVQIAPLGISDAETSVQIRLVGRMPMGRQEVKLQWQAAPLSTPFDAATVVSGTSADWTDILTRGVVIAEQVSGLIPGAPYHWRVRTLYRPGNPLGQPVGRWVHIPWNGWAEQDFRTPGECTPAAQASFSWLPSLPAAGEAIAFTGTATGTLPLAFSWDWVDGGSASGSTVTHTYVLPGTYPVVLIVAGPCGGRVLVRHTVYVGFPGGWHLYLPLVGKGYRP